MTGDFSRWRAPNARAQGYTGVLMQQGRLYTDSDWNENVSIQGQRMDSALASAIGPAGTPRDAPGFQIGPAAGGFIIGAGSYWIDGTELQNPATLTYAAQVGSDLEPLSAIPAGSEVLIHLTLRRDEVSGLEDRLLTDPALSGVDTAVRERALWRVAVRPVTLTVAERATLIDRARCGFAPDLPDWRPGTGRMSAGTAPAADLPDDSDCLIAPDAGYLAQENQLYRVQIIRGGPREQARFVWSRENGSVQARLHQHPVSGAFTLIGAREDEALGFPPGCWVEVIDDRNAALGTAGTMTRMTLTDGIASFSPGIAGFAQMVNPRLRRWDHGGVATEGLALTGTPKLLERGVQVAFAPGTYVTGDAWMFEARAATGSVIWPPVPGAPDEAVPPMTRPAHYAALALAQWTGGGLANLTDLRATFPALTCIHADDVEYDDSLSGLGAKNVQGAVAALAMRRQSSICTAIVTNVDELTKAVAKLGAKQSARLCLAGGQYPLAGTLTFKGLGHVIIQGAGPQEVISVAQGEAAFRFEKCASVRVADISVNGGPTGQGENGARRGGALTMLDCGDISIERVRARCRAGQERAASCISSLGRASQYRQEVRIRDCVLRVGQAQVGVLIVGASHTIIEDNLILPVPAKTDLILPVPAETDLTRARVQTDAALRSRIAHGLVRFSKHTAIVRPSLIVHSAEHAFSDDPIDQLGDLAEDALNFAGEDTAIPLYKGEPITIRALPPLGQVLTQVIAAHPRNRIVVPAEMRHHLRNLLREGVASAGHRVMLGHKSVTLLPEKHFRLAESPFIAEGIVLGGAQIDEARITGNRIEDANDGIRLAASGTDDPDPPSWRSRRPKNRILHAVIEGNTITLNPLSSASAAHGIYLGHVERASLSRNSVLMPDKFRVDAVMPHFGIFQFGWRGQLLTISENQVSGMENGIAVAPTLDEGPRGIWILRDNAAARTRRAFVLAQGVTLA